jgi:2-dehydropantoate 2-reductase
MPFTWWGFGVAIGSPTGEAQGVNASRDRMRVVVVGAGGVGGLLGALLARQGDEVTFVATESTSSLLNSEGLRVNSDLFGNFTVRVLAVTLLTSPTDVCIFAVKATQLEAAMERVPKDVLGGSVVVPFLNGVEHVDILRRTYGTAVVAGTMRVASTRTAAGVIEHSSPFVRVEVAVAAGLDDSHKEAVLRFGDHLTAAGVDVDVREDELLMLWGKLIFLGPLALLTTRYGTSAGDVRTAHRAELIALIEEIARVGAALDAPLSAEVALEFFDSVPATMQSSMQHDAAAGNPIELDGIGGAVLRAADRTGVPVPTTQRLVRELRQRSLA